MAVVPADLRAPKGEIEPAFFPKEDEAALDARLSAYIEAATAALPAGLAAETADAGVTAYAYYRAFRAVWLRLSAAPSSMSFNDQGSRSFTASQIDNFRAASESYLEAWNAILGTVAVVTSLPAGSQTTPIEFTY